MWNFGAPLALSTPTADDTGIPTIATRATIAVSRFIYCLLARERPDARCLEY